MYDINLFLRCYFVQLYSMIVVNWPKIQKLIDFYNFILKKFGGLKNNVYFCKRFQNGDLITIFVNSYRIVRIDSEN